MFANKHPALRLFVYRAPQPALRAPGAQNAGSGQMRVKTICIWGKIGI